jgi:t-SNARE complex subunit (syntaxin)
VTKKLSNNEILGRVEDTHSPATMENAIARSQEKTRSNLVFCLLVLISIIFVVSVLYFKPSSEEGWNFTKIIIT